MYARLNFCSVYFFALMVLVSACATQGPITSLKVSEENTLVDWDTRAATDSSDCYSLYTKFNNWGVFIGCQAIDIFDVRTVTVNNLFVDNLSRQGCSTKPGVDGQRNYIRTGEHLLFLDKTGINANAWFVPAGYYSDGVSTPNVLREIVPGAILDTESPRTLSAALFHDRYFCLFEYTSIAWNAERDNFPSKLKGIIQNGGELPTAYRRKGCANASFRNGLRAAGASSIVATVFRRMVGIVNPGKKGYCPKIIHADALGVLDAKFENMLGYGENGTYQRKELPGCRENEPVFLCLSRVEALWFLVATRDDDYDTTATPRIPDEWRQVFMRIMCYEMQAHTLEGNWPWSTIFNRAQANDLCGLIDLDRLPAENEALRTDFQEVHDIYTNQELAIESPFRAGDFMVEAALMLMQENGPEIFLSTVSGLNTIDYAMLAIVNWNEEFDPASRSE